MHHLSRDFFNLLTLAAAAYAAFVVLFPVGEYGWLIPAGIVGADVVYIALSMRKDME